MRRKSVKYVVICIIALLLSIMPAQKVMAVQAEAKIITKDNVTTAYLTVSAALKAMEDGDTLCLMKDSNVQINVPPAKKWKLSANEYSYSGNIVLNNGSGIELLDGKYTGDFYITIALSNKITIDDGVKADKSGRLILERYTNNTQWAREYESDNYIIETSNDLPYKVNGKVFASSARATRELTNGGNLYIVKDTDRGILSDNLINKSFNIIADNNVVNGEIHLSEKTKIVSGIFMGELYQIENGEYTFGEKARFNKNSMASLRSMCQDDSKVEYDSDGYCVVVSANTADKIVNVNGKSYVYVEHALRNTDANTLTTINITSDYNDYITVPFVNKIKLDLKDNYMRNHIENFGQLEIISGKFDGYEDGTNTYIVTTQPVTISGGYFGNIAFYTWDWGNPKYIIKGGTFSAQAYEQIKDYVADGYQAVYKDGNYVIQKGSKLTGWQKIDGKWYYYNSNGDKTTGWQKVSGKWYYLNSDGVMQTGWQKIKNKWYYFNASGVMQTSKWIKSGSKWYYVDASGVMQTSKWIKSAGKWYYVDANGVMQTSKWVKISSKWYYFNANGIMQTSKWINGTYYIKADGTMAISEWVDNGRYYVGTDGKWIKNATK